MSAKDKRFTVLALSDRDKWGFNEKTLPLLVALMESTSPDDLKIDSSGVTGYYIKSNRGMIRVEKAIQEAEKLRDSDERFAMLGIGLAEGEMMADFHWWGSHKKTGLPPIGQAVVEAVRCSYDPDCYLDKLNALRARNTNRVS